ncbi:MAG: general secretion pathway protein GspB [Planctomycetota bacterium]|jgi:hypothetical protein|nr:general secretion pathway protein GspB [Planctomycetota bacterium]
MKKILLAVLLFGCPPFGPIGTAPGGQPARNRGKAQAPPKPEDPMDKLSVEELRAYQSYFFARGGRDPLIMRLPTNEELGLGNSPAPVRRAPSLDEMNRRFAEWREDARQALMNRKFEDALKECEDAIAYIDGDWRQYIRLDQPSDPKISRQRRMIADIRNYHGLAQELKRKEDARTEFESLRLRVEGVIWSPYDAKAVINGRLLSAGEVMLAERRQGDLRVEAIEERGVVFQFKNVRFRLNVELLSPPAGASGARRRGA